MLKQNPYQGNPQENGPKHHELIVLLHAETKSPGLICYIREQYLGGLEVMGKWMEKVEHWGVKWRKKMIIPKYLSLNLKPKVVAGKSEPCEDKATKHLPCQSPRLVWYSPRHNDPTHCTFDICGCGHWGMVTRYMTLC